MVVSNLALVIEDDEKLAGIYAKMLETLNFETKIIQDGAPALIWLAKTVPNLIVLDLHLPHVAGQDILKQIQADSRFAQTQIIVITADVALGRRLHEAGEMVLIKPFSVREFRELVVRLKSQATDD